MILLPLGNYAFTIAIVHAKFSYLANDNFWCPAVYIQAYW